MRLVACLVLVGLAGCLDPAVVDDVAVAGPEMVAQITAWDGEAFVPVEPGDAVVRPGHPVRFEAVCDGFCEVPVHGGSTFEVRWDGAVTPPVLPQETRTHDRGYAHGHDALRQYGGGPPFVFEAYGPVWGEIRATGTDVEVLAGDRMLPNIVTYAPVQIGVEPCQEIEGREQGATRCLRLGNAIGNTGDGPLQVVLPPADGVLTAAGMGAFDQRVLLRDGGHEDHEVGNADIHLTHGHFHYDGFARFSLYGHDLETGLRGDLAAEHKKSGFCFLDWGRMDDGEPEGGHYAEDDCLVPGTDGWTMGVTAGWFDFYWASLTDQYIDIAGVPDGVYELVSEADWSDSLVETDEGDNSASAVLRITGDEVEVLETRSFFELPEDTGNL